jgi:cyclohexanone monooxygenase
VSAGKHKTDPLRQVDIDALRKRYREERDRRLRAEGKAQYQEVSGQFGRYVDDPWAHPDAARAPISETTEVLVVGGGFGGLLCGARLREAGIDNFRIVE